jgi:hypothetical protein
MYDWERQAETPPTVANEKRADSLHLSVVFVDNVCHCAMKTLIAFIVKAIHLTQNVFPSSAVNWCIDNESRQWNYDHLRSSC